MKDTKKIVISLGGSIMIPLEFNIPFVRQFIASIREYTQQGYSFFIITGGGATARLYQNGLKEVTGNSKDIEMLDWIGIFSTRLNAEFMRLAFGSEATDVVFWNPCDFSTINKPIAIGAGDTPGHSTDHTAVLTAKGINSSRVINLSNIAYVYDSDPKKNSNAIKKEKLTWDEYFSFIPKEWTPGMNVPFDVKASYMAQKNGIEVCIINGNNIESFKNCIEGKAFEGTMLYDKS